MEQTSLQNHPSSLRCLLWGDLDEKPLETSSGLNCMAPGRVTPKLTLQQGHVHSQRRAGGSERAGAPSSREGRLVVSTATDTEMDLHGNNKAVKEK